MEERAARRASVRAKKFPEVKADVDKADAARKASKKGEYAPSYAKKETDVTVYDDKPTAKKKAATPKKPAVPKKPAAPAKPAAPKKPVTQKVVKAVAKVKQTQPVKKPSKPGLADRIRSAYKAGVKRHRKATQVPRVFAKGAVAGAKKAVKFAKDVKKVVSEETECDCDCGQDPCIECGESHHTVNEDLIGPATALCGSGLAFFLRSIRAAAHGGSFRRQQHLSEQEGAVLPQVPRRAPA